MLLHVGAVGVAVVAVVIVGVVTVVIADAAGSAAHAVGTIFIIVAEGWCSSSGVFASCRETSVSKSHA